MTRSALNDEAGGRTQLAGGVAAVGVGVVLLFLTDVFTLLPEAILAAVILVAARGLVDIPKLERIYRINKIEFVIASLTLLGVLVFGMLPGILIGVVGSLVVVFARITYPHTVILGRIPGTENFGEIEYHPEYNEVSNVLVYRVNAELFYANAQTVETEIIDLLDENEAPVNLMVFDLSASPTLDLTTVDMLQGLSKRLETRGVVLRLAEVSDEACATLRAAAMRESLNAVEPNCTIAAVIDKWHTESTSG